MKTKHGIILVTLGIFLLLWAACLATAFVLSPELTFPTSIREPSVIVILSTFIIILIASVVIGFIMQIINQQRAKTEESLEDSENKINALSEAASEGIFIHDNNL
ncbi:MAG: hypothetical protein PHY28_08460, partial [Dehalococcoidales bacterium]|nr:hypothetical protein [Dehalococcoidales bacterium]